MAYKPISEEYLQDGLNKYVQSQPIPVQEQLPPVDTRSFAEIAKDDIVNTVSNYLDGAVSGYQELERADANLKANSEQVESPYGSYSVPTTDSAQYFDKALLAFAEETIKPVLGPLALATGVGALAAPATFANAAAITGTAYLPFMASDAYKSYDSAANPHAGMGDLRQEERSQGEVPIGGVVEGLKTLGRDFTYGGIYDFATNPDLDKNFHDKPISTIGEGVMQATNAAMLGLGAVHGVKSAKKGIDTARKFNLTETVEAKLNELRPYENMAINGLDALDQYDSPTRGFRPANKQELQQTVMEQLEQLKAKKFDEANQQSYMNDMARQERESNALQAQKNEIAGSVLMSPLDRMEVGADLPVKRSLGGQGEVLGEQPIQSTIVNPSQRTAGRIELPNQVSNLKNKIENPLERQQMIKETSKEHLEIVRAVEEKVQLQKMLTELEGHKNAYIDEMVKHYENNPGGKGVKQGYITRDSQGNVVNRAGRESLNPQWYQEYYAEYGSKPSKARLREFAEKQLEGSKEAPEGHADFIEIKSMIDNIKGILSGNKKLQSGIDPTGGRFDNVDLGAKAKEAIVKSRDRIVNGLQDDRIIDNGRKWYEKGIKDLPPIKKVLQRVYQEVFDSLDPISRYDKEVYKSARLANGTAVGKADSMIRNKNNPDSFENIIKPVENRLDDFAEYMVAKRAKELHATGTMTGVSNTKIAKILSEAPPEFAEVQKQLSSYSDRLVEMLVDSGMISEEHAINMFNKYESYAPMMQAFDGEQISRMFQDKGDLGKPIKNIEGSDSKVINPIESILKNTHTFHMIAETNKVRQQIASLAESFPDEIKILKSGEAAEKGTGTFDFFVDGKKMTMQLEPRLFEAIASMDSQQTSIVVKVLSKPASWLRAGATLSPEFLVKNLIRDTIGAGIVGKDFTPFVDSYKGLKSAWKKDQDYWDYKEAGGATGHLTGLDRNHLQEALDNYRAKSKVQKLSTAFNPKTWLEVLRKGQEISEDATKLGYYKKRISKGDSVKEATFEARDLLDFSRSGNYTREANKVAAFLNASLQGTDKLVRSFKNRPLETAANTMKYLIMPSMAVWYMQSKSDKKDEIQNLPKYVRDMFWVIPAGDKLIRIPKPFEPGVLFATGTERTLDAMFSDKRTPYKGYGDSLWEVTFPNLLPTGLLPLGEWWANKSFFTGQSIVPQKEQDLPDDMQYGPYTSNVAKFAGKMTGQSPRKIDNAIRGLTGGAGTAVTSIIDSVTGGNTGRPSQTLSDMPVVKAFIADPRKGQQSTQDFYDELDKYTKSKRAESVRGVKMTPNEKRNYEQLNNANTALKALNKEERKIIESTKFSPEVKRQKLDKIIDAQTKLVQASLKRLK